MKLNLPKRVSRNIRVRLTGDLHNNVTITIGFGPLVARLEFSKEEFQRVLGDLLTELGDEWALMDYLMEQLAIRQAPEQKEIGWKTADELPSPHLRTSPRPQLRREEPDESQITTVGPSGTFYGHMEDAP